MKTTPLIVLFLVAVAVRQSASKYTTLLEDEQQQQQGQELAAATTKNKPTTVTYGNLIYEPPTRDQQSQTVESSNKDANVAIGGPKAAEATKGGGAKDDGGGATVFKRLYSKITSYLPFLAQLTNLRQPSGTNTTTSSDSELHAKTNVSVSTVRDVSRPIGKDEDQESKPVASGDGGGGNGIKNDDGENSNSKAAKGVNNDNNIDVGANQDNQQLQNNDKQQRGKVNVKISIDRTKLTQGNQAGERNQGDNEVGNREEEQDAIAAYNNFVGQFGRPIGQLATSDGLDDEEQFADTKSGGQKRDQQYVLEDNDDNRNSYYNPENQASAADLDVDMSQMIPVAIGLGNLQRFVDQDDDDLQQQQQQPMDRAANRYNMMRQSNLVVPVDSNDAILTGPTSESTGAISSDSNKQPESLLGKYIYAPTQHYYLNPVIPQPMAAGQRSHVLAGGKHIQPGDHIYSSYGPDKPMKAAYAYSKEHNSIGDKPNDLYFLIMVGAFCMMATTIVLAAGLFAYRIQQNRKSSQDTGYPTYGVVGPNNMSAKCGAASFVGGYFTGPPGGGCDSSKSGSARHLADLYGNTPNGVGGSDSGLNSLDKSSSNKKASSVSSLNEFHQSATSRAASSNFMAAASQDAARMYHYQHQKQQMIISDRNSGGRQTTASDLDSEDENDDCSYTVYECPGLASAHEMEIKNPLFNDDQSP